MTIASIRPLAIGAAIGGTAGLTGLGLYASVRAGAPHEGDTYGSLRAGEGLRYATLGDRVGSFDTLDDAKAAVEQLGGDSSYVFVQKGVSILNRERNWVFEVDRDDARALHDSRMTNIGADVGQHNELVGVWHGDAYRGMVDDRTSSGAGRYIENEWW